jgi:hypothetical protein
MEVSTVIAITAILASVAVVVSNQEISGANTQSGNSEVKLIGVSILSFIQDTGFAPAFLSGQSTGPNDGVVLVLQTTGADPSDATQTWPSTGESRDLLNNHIVQDNPAGSGIPYLRIGEISYARFKGWNGPYMSRLPSADPWGDRYLVNIGFATSQGAHLANLPTGKRPAVFVLSAGANRQIETNFIQAADEFVAGGDDQVFRIQ